MTDTAGTSEGVAPEAAPSSGPDESQTTPVATGDQSSAENPAWKPYRDKLGKMFDLVKDDFAENDRQVQARIEKANAAAKQYEGLGSLEQLQQYASLGQQIGSDPKAVYERLGDWLRQNGQLEAAKEVEAQAADLSEEEDPEVDPQLEELKRGQEEIKQFFEAQRQAEAVERATGELQTKMAGIRTANAWMTEDDENEVLARALSNAQSSDKDVDLDEAAQQYIQLRTRFLTTPRPGNSAPDLVPNGGGAPATQSDFNFSKASKEDRRSYIGEWLKANSSN